MNNKSLSNIKHIKGGNGGKVSGGFFKCQACGRTLTWFTKEYNSKPTYCNQCTSSKSTNQATITT